MNRLKVATAITVGLVFVHVRGSAQTAISSLPYTIDAAGVYVLNQSLRYPFGTGNAITVKATNVTINLNGYGISNTSDQTKTNATCIDANNIENLTVENGEIFGFWIGIHLAGPSSGLSFNAGHILQGLRLAYCGNVGIFLDFASNCLIQNCQLSWIGITGGGVQINNNAAGIFVQSLTGGNRIYRCQVLRATGDGFFARASGAQGSYLEQNLATSCAFGFVFEDGVDAYRDNASFGCTGGAFLLGNDFGGNHSQ